MRDLPIGFTGKGQVKGFKFTQVKKTENGYIYKVQHLDRVWYEVFKKVENIRYSVISYPRSKSFGVWAWTTFSLNRAESILEEIELKCASKS